MLETRKSSQLRRNHDKHDNLGVNIFDKVELKCPYWLLGSSVCTALNISRKTSVSFRKFWPRFLPKSQFSDGNLVTTWRYFSEKRAEIVVHTLVKHCSYTKKLCLNVYPLFSADHSHQGHSIMMISLTRKFTPELVPFE